jgi:hypothetical protein
MSCTDAVIFISLHFTSHPFTSLHFTTMWGVDVYIHASLTTALVEGELSASRPDRFTPPDKDEFLR